MIYTVKWDEDALEDLSSLGKTEAIRIVKKIESHLVKDPLNLGKPLTGNLSGLYRYRIGDYRIIYQIFKNELIVVVVRVGHRRDVYG
ncbi:MAG: type II toxin-antitoxin system RelE/ParE family toxin [Pseudomonadota bacterium]